MKNLKLSSLAFLAVIVFVLPLSACGSGGGGGGSSSPVTLEDLAGNYQLIGFSISNRVKELSLQDTSFVGSLVRSANSRKQTAYPKALTITDDNVSSYSGSMTITSGGLLSQTITIEGNMVIIKQNITVSDNKIHTSTENGCSYSIDFTFDGSILETTFKKGTCGVTFSEIDRWKKL